MIEDGKWRPSTAVEAEAYLHGVLGTLEDMADMAAEILESVSNLVDAIRISIASAPGMSARFIAGLSSDDEK